MKKNEIDPNTKIDIAAVNEEVLDGYLVKLGLPTKGIVPLRLLRLHEAMQLFPDKSKLANCTPSKDKPGCRGSSHVDLNCCPFCGDGDADQTVASQRSNAADPEQLVIDELKRLIEKKQAADEKLAEEKRAVDERFAAEFAAKEKEKNKHVTVPSPVAGQALVPVGKSKRAAKKTAQSALALDTANTAVVDAPNAPLTAEDLDISNEIIRDGFKRAKLGVYDAAAEMFRVFSNKAWMQRRNPDGTSKYSSWAQWVNAEHGYSEDYAYQLIDLPKFFTREQAATIDPTKLILSLRIEDSERRKMLESGELEKLTVRQVKSRITQNPLTEARNPERGDKGSKASHTRLPGGTKSTSKGTNKLGSVGTSAPANDTPAPPPPRTPERITIHTCMLPTAIDFKMLARNHSEGKPDVPATDLKDDPYAYITCANGVELRLLVFKGQDGTLKGSLTVVSNSDLVSHEHDEPDPDNEEE
jgi:hypothetical protein